ncbi:MAG: restriction endonuclease subunit S [Anaerovoracaceae bacterium]
MKAAELRKSILQYAIQGRLVPQIESEEPASVLLEKIKAEKEKLIAEGKIKKQKPLPDITDEEKPFEIPKTWAWVRLGDVSNYGECEKIVADEIEPDCWVLDLEDVQKETGMVIRFKTMIEIKSLSAKHLFTKGTVLYSKLRPYLNKVLVAEKEGCCTSEILPISLFGEINPYYAKLFLMSPEFVDYASQCSYGVKMPRLGTQDGKKTMFPLPPLDEQKRIVACVEELMLLADEYEEKQIRLEKLETEFPEKLKKSILQYAIQGRLVPQIASEEPASVLLKKIKAEKEKLISEGKIKKQKLLPEIADDEKPFEIPKTWVWVRLGEIGEFVRGSGIKRSETTLNGVPCVRYGELYTTYNLQTKSTASFTSEDVASKAKEIYFGDILFTLTGEKKDEIGKAIAFFGNERTVIGGDLAQFSHGQNALYLTYLMYSQYMIEEKSRKSNGDIIVHISAKKLAEMPIPLPPLEEQKRIVARVEELMGVVEGIGG